MLIEYIQAAQSATLNMRFCRMMALTMARSRKCAGVYANADTLEDCRDQVQEVLEEWLLFRVHRNLPIPVVDGIELAIKEVA